VASPEQRGNAYFARTDAAAFNILKSLDYIAQRNDVTSASQRGLFDVETEIIVQPNGVGSVQTSNGGLSSTIGFSLEERRAPELGAPKPLLDPNAFAEISVGDPTTMQSRVLIDLAEHGYDVASSQPERLNQLAPLGIDDLNRELVMIGLDDLARSAPQAKRELWTATADHLLEAGPSASLGSPGLS
jgi:hypothetical protein